MSGEQRDVEVIREGIAFQRIEKLPPDDPGWEIVEHALAALDRLAAALERAERERNEAYERVYDRAAESVTNKLEARVEKAERALAEMREALKRLCESAPDGPWFNADTKVYLRDLERARAALRPSEDTSDES